MDWNVIDSRQNPAVKFASCLTEKKYRDKYGVFLAEGKTILAELVSSGISPKAVYLSREARLSVRETDEILGEAPSERYLLSASAFEKITTEKGSEGIVSLFYHSDIETLFASKPLSRLVALETVQDPGNVGTILRSAAALGFDAVLTVSCADPFSPKAIRASMGAVAHIPVKNFSDTAALFSFLRDYHIISVAAALHENAKPIHELSLSEPFCILIGNEGKGLSREAILLADECSVIPIQNVESLNAAAAATIYLWEFGKKGDSREKR